VRGTRRLSYSDQKRLHRKRLRVLLLLALVFITYAALSGVFLSPFRVGSASMAPALQPGDRILLSPIVFGPMSILSGKPLPGFRSPRRGDIVLAEPPGTVRRGGLALAADNLVRFFTLQTIGLGGKASVEPVLKRVVGLPGDTLRIRGFTAYIRPEGESGYFSEDELAPSPYDTVLPVLPEGWDSGLPFSGDVEEIVLGPGQYYLLSDDRGVFYDSRSWGPLEEDAIRALYIGRYWPLGRR